MVAKKIVVGMSCAILVSAGVLIALLGQAKITPVDDEKLNKTPVKQVVKPAPVVEKKYDLYANTSYELSLSSIMEISKLTPEMKKTVDELLEQSGGLYYLKNESENKIVLILQNSVSNDSTYTRHNLEMVEIVKNEDGSVSKNISSLGYRGYDGEIINAISQDDKRDEYWKFDKSYEPYRPLKHVIYDEKGKTKFTEYWSYSPKESVKYVMKDAKGNILSIFKETLEDDVNLRQEHVFYDDDKNIAMTVSINYDGADITRFTYYNTYDLGLSATIMTEYADGLKHKESVYSNNYELLNVLTSEYIDGVRKTIRLFDNENKEIKKISS